MSVTAPLPHDAAALLVTGRSRYVDDIPTPAGTLHLALGRANIARGRITEIYGPESSGKTTLCLHVIANALFAVVRLRM
jgi:RecA/RadA recombinase